MVYQLASANLSLPTQPYQLLSMNFPLSTSLYPTFLSQLLINKVPGTALRTSLDWFAVASARLAGRFGHPEPASTSINHFSISLFLYLSI
jgi:hypothetical protein